jgi:hypothetical protein
MYMNPAALNNFRAPIRSPIRPASPPPYYCESCGSETNNTESEPDQNSSEVDILALNSANLAKIVESLSTSVAEMKEIIKNLSQR